MTAELHPVTQGDCNFTVVDSKDFTIYMLSEPGDFAKLEAEFKSHITKEPGGCWLWNGTLRTDGYGFFYWKHRQFRAHRIAWLLDRGFIPYGLDVLHQCDVRNCVNPSHLFLGTDKDNHQDKTRKGRHPQAKKTHCPQGHEYTPENTYRGKSANNRHCRACMKLRRKAVRRG